MHDGRNAWVAVHFTVDGTGTLPRGTALFTKIMQPLPGQAIPPDRLLPAGALTVDLLQQSPDFRDVVAFETAYTQTFRTRNNEIRVHTWGEEECCLPVGTTEAWLYTDDGGTGVRPVLADGDYVMLEERVGPRTGAVPDADPAHRQLVRIEGAPEQTEDPLYAAALVAGVPVVRNAGDPALPLLRITWRRADALDFPLCLSARLRDGTLVREVSVVRGNIVLADQGLTTEETQTPDELSVDGRMQLSRAPLTQEIRDLDAPIDATTGRFAVDRRDLTGDVRTVLPAVTLQVATPIDTEEWRSMPDLFDSGPLDEHFVAEVDDDGRAILRFGDGEYGHELPDINGAARGLPRRQRPPRQRRPRHHRPRRPRRPEHLDHVAPQPARRHRGRRRGDDRTGTPARAAGVPHRALPRGHRKRLGRRREAPRRRPRRRSRATAGRGAGRRSSSPSTRPTAPTSSTFRTETRASSRPSRHRCGPS